MFTLTHDPIDSHSLNQSLARMDAGALVTFEGWIRNRNEGRTVSSLEYTAYEILATKEGLAVMDAALQNHPILAAKAVHRLGHLQLGELAVWVGVVAVHREAAFRACEEIINEIKARVPIWKHEHYSDATAGWVQPNQSTP